MNADDLKRAIKYIFPPFFIDAGKGLVTALRREKPEWEYMPEGWRAAEKDPKIKGWNVESVLEAYKASWPQFVQNLESAGPFTASPEAITGSQTDLFFHNRIMVYAYALALAARQKKSISMLDWGGGIGHYYLISRALIPGLEIDYYCHDLPLLAAFGQQQFPRAHYDSDDACLEGHFDFVLVSNSLQYSLDWTTTLRKLARATAGYLLVTMLPIVERVPSYVFVQRPYQYGYDTEYLAWCLNRSEFLDAAESSGLELVREFAIGLEPPIVRAPEPCRYLAFLFRSKRFSDVTQP